jgi:predicted transcriptional regulator
MSKDQAQTYLRFLNLVSAIRGLPTLPALDALEERVLNGLAANWATGTRITVLEAMSLPLDTSPTTVHRRLKALEKKGVIEFQEDKVDSRIKYVMPTYLATTYFRKMGQCLDMAARNQSG